MRGKLVGLIVTGSAVSAFTVLLGRLWTTSYFQYFGLPVDDLTLDVQDYAFRTKEILLMLILASALIVGIVWRSDDLGISGDTDRAFWSGYRIVWTVLLCLAVVFLVVFFVLTAAEKPWIENNWRWLPVSIGIALGISAGVIIAFARRAGSPLGWMGAAVAITAAIILVPFSIDKLARASAAFNVRT